MRVPSGTASRPHHMICPFCESGELVSLGPGSARCKSCGLPLLGSTLETLRDITGLPDALGAHPCECGHPEMRALPGGGEELPSVSLYKMGSFYFVLDGHHRVSVARYHGVEWIDAHVTEFGAGGLWSERSDRETA